MRDVTGMKLNRRGKAAASRRTSEWKPSIRCGVRELATAYAGIVLLGDSAIDSSCLGLGNRSRISVSRNERVTRANGLNRSFKDSAG